MSLVVAKVVHAFAARHAMSATPFLIGAGLTRGALHAFGPRALVQGVLLWGMVASGSLAAVALGVVG